MANFNRGYQKSIIEKELEEQRRDQGLLWKQTKESILEAREILSSTDSITGELRDRQREMIRQHNGDYARLPLDESSLDILKS